MEEWVRPASVCEGDGVTERLGERETEGLGEFRDFEFRICGFWISWKQEKQADGSR